MTVVTTPLAKGAYFGSKYAKDRVASAVAIGAGITDTYQVNVSDFDNLTVLASQTGAAITDLVLTVFALDTTGTAHQIPLAPSVTSPAQVIVGGAVLAVQQYDLRGIDGIQINVKNANAGAETTNFVDILAGITGCDSL